jgi:hypothetical protein
MTVKIRMVGAVKKLLGGAVGVLSHAAWWLRYQVDGTARHDPPPPPGEGDDS